MWRLGLDLKLHRSKVQVLTLRTKMCHLTTPRHYGGAFRVLPGSMNLPSDTFAIAEGVRRGIL
jgi:hypothetical protein